MHLIKLKYCANCYHYYFMLYVCNNKANQSELLQMIKKFLLNHRAINRKVIITEHPALYFVSIHYGESYNFTGRRITLSWSVKFYFRSSTTGHTVHVRLY